MNLRIPKIAVYLSGVTIIMFGFQGSKTTTNLASASYEKSSTSVCSVNSVESSSVNSIISSTVSSATSSMAASSTAVSSNAVSSKTPIAKPKVVVPTKAQLQAATKVIPTKAQKAAEDPEAIKAKSSTPVKNSVTVSSTASSTASSAVSSAASSSVSSAISSTVSSTPIITGWKTVGGAKYFYYQNKPLTYWQTIDGKKYYFDNRGALKTRLGIDVSEYQGTIDWKKVKAAGVDFAIIRAGWRGYGGGSYNKDACFEQNYNGAKAAGISVGVYFFSQAITVEEAVAEAQFTLDILGGRSLSEPIAIDIESISDPTARTNTANLTNQQRTDFGIAFCQKIKSSGSTPMVYSGKYYFNNYLNVSQLAPYTTWVAQYLYDSPNEGTTYQYSYKYWQYTSSGKIDGIYSSGLDMNISF